MAANNVIIRKANADDMIDVYNLIKELAEFEKMPDGPKIDYKVLQKDGFESTPPAFMCLVAEYDAKIVGYAIYYYTYSTWRGRVMFLEDIYVKAQFRRHGIGLLLLKAVAKETVNANCARLNFQVLSWNPATMFYERYGAQNLTKSEQWNFFQFDREGLEKLLS